MTEKCKQCNSEESCDCNLEPEIEQEWNEYLDDLEEEYYKQEEEKKRRYNKRYVHGGPQRAARKQSKD